MSKEKTISGSIFISHTKTDKPFVRILAHKLEHCGITTWVDEASMLVGDSLIEKIQEGIATMDYLGVVLSPDSIKSAWVQKELKSALNMEIAEKRVKVLPILYQDCEIPVFLLDKLYADFRKLEPDTQEFNNAVEQLLKRLRQGSALIIDENHLTDAVNLILHQSYELWKQQGTLIKKDQLDDLFEHRSKLKITDHNWLVLAESALAQSDFTRWIGLVNDNQVWSAIKYVLTNSNNEKALLATIPLISNKASFSQSDYLMFISFLLTKDFTWAVSTALTKALVTIPNTELFDSVVNLYIEKCKDTSSSELIIKLIQGKSHWYNKLGTEFFLRFVDTPHLIVPETHFALQVIAELGDRTVIPTLKNLYLAGFGGNEAIGEAYLEQIKITLEALGADISDLN
jgi:hypothetical protein